MDSEKTESNRRCQMKNYPNQASSFKKVRGTLATVQEMMTRGDDPADDFQLGYSAARNRIYTFRGLSASDVSTHLIEQRIAEEMEKPKASQGALTFARELRRTLRDMGWIDQDSLLSRRGSELLETSPGSLREQSLLIEGLLNITAAYKGDTTVHHPVRTMLHLLAHRPSRNRAGLELALEPLDDSASELQRVIDLYDKSADDRARILDISSHQRANAVKIFPALAVHAGLVTMDNSNVYSLTLDGWQAIHKKATDAGRAITRTRGRRASPGRLVTPSTIAKVRESGESRRLLTPEEQQMAAERLAERTGAHQELVSRMARTLPAEKGRIFEDEFSYDMLWIPDNEIHPIILFEMKSVTGEADAYARGRDALAQLKYYAYFNVSPVSEGRRIRLCFVSNDRIPEELARFLAREGVGAVVSCESEPPFSLNQPGEDILDQLQ